MGSGCFRKTQRVEYLNSRQWLKGVACLGAIDAGVAQEQMLPYFGLFGLIGHHTHVIPLQIVV